MASDGGEGGTGSARSGRSASSRASTRAANFRCGRTARSSSAARPTSTWCWSRTWCRASTPRSPPTSNVVTIQDLGSTNGTFVNGEKIRKADLKDGDRILIGTSIIKIVFVDGESTSHLTETEARSKLAVAANKRSAAAPKSMSGSIEEIPLPDLLQLLSTSRKSGVLVVHSDRARRQDLPAQGADLLRHHREPVQHRPAQGADPHADLDAGHVRARAAGRDARCWRRSRSRPRGC